MELEKGEKNWETISAKIRKSAKKALGESSGNKKEGKEIWWWNEEVQLVVKRKKECKKNRDHNRTEETIKAFKEVNKTAKLAVAKVKATAYEELYNSLEMDVYQAKTIKDANENILSNDRQIKNRWKEYFQHLMNVENEREHRSIQPLAGEPMERITETEVKVALRKMKNGKSVGPDNIPAEVRKHLGNTGVELQTK
ncbi:uncharacterized protein LOC119583401 [Penaeus monodon]|uniref:uncharacterized protein LOC119583401 n=1 Tax=Penaeus monodon TaxID=6687 RepID=UPI0018A7DF8E|nr:uncharacterized protein LOC119583401 [Penaeus monodon]